MILAAVLGSLIVAILSTLLVNYFRQVLAFRELRKLSPKLPIVKELTSVFGGFAKTVIHHPRNVFIIDNYANKYKHNAGGLYKTQYIVATSDLDLIKQIVLDEPYKNINRTALDCPVDEIANDCILTAEDDQWKRIRNASAPSFTNHKIKSMPNVQKEIEQVIEKFAKALDDSIENNNHELNSRKEEKNSIILDSIETFHRFSTALIFKSFYKQDDLVSYDFRKKDHWVELITKCLNGMLSKLLIVIILFPIIKPIVSWYINHIHPQGKLSKEIIKFIKLQTKLNFDARKEFKSAKLEAEKKGDKFDPDSYHLKDGTKFNRNLMDHFIDQFHAGKVTQSEFFNSSLIIFLAADKTMADALAMLIYNLAMNPEAQEKLRESIMLDGMESEYLMWCMNESMRLFPPVLNGATRTTKQDYTTKDGIFVPKGTLVYVAVYSIHRYPEYWGDDVLEYKPERWLNAKDFHPCQFIPFGFGPRECLGKQFALHSMKMTMNVLMKRFKFDKCEKTTDNHYFSSPFFSVTIFDEPHFVKISTINDNNNNNNNNDF